ncbi:MAG: amidohydrolase family protein [Oscillospiraceae bacterium]|nr:amidohydrolase family protein [Oscillospiraceae bacterium]
MRNGYHIIDAHCHIYPDSLAHRAAENISEFYDGIDFCGGDVGALLQLMERQGIDFSIVNSAAMKPHQVESVNQFILESCEAHPDKLAPVGTLHPDSTHMEHDLQFITDHGFHGIKMHPDMLDIPLDDPRFLRIYALCQEADVPVLLHTGDRRYDNTNPNRFGPVVAKFPALTFIGGHFAGRDFFCEAADTLHQYQNLYADCSSAFNQLTPEQALYCIRTYTADHILFGTDHPVFTPGYDLDYLFSLPLTAEELGKILSGTAQTVYRVLPPWETPACAE